jgi:hypothetical protein
MAARMQRRPMREPALPALNALGVGTVGAHVCLRVVGECRHWASISDISGAFCHTGGAKACALRQWGLLECAGDTMPFLRTCAAAADDTAQLRGHKSRCLRATTLHSVA